MSNDKDIQPFVWPTEEPDIPPPPEAPSSGAHAAASEAAAAREPVPDHLPDGVDPDSTHAYVWRHAEGAAAVLRTLMLSDEGGGHEGPLAGMGARQVTAAFLSGLGPQVGSRVLHQLRGEVETRWVAQAVAEEKPVRHYTAVAALDLVRRRIEAGDYLEDGGPEYAVQLLEEAFGPHRAQWLLRAEHEPGEGFRMLKEVAPEQVAPFISHEHPQTIAITLSQLDPRQAAGILAQLPQRMQADVAYRVSTMENITPAALTEVEEALEASLSDMLSGNADVGGPKVVADMLNFSGSSTEKNVLDQMDAQDPEVAEAVRLMMFTFADIGKLPQRDLQTFVQEVDPKDLLISLKAVEKEILDRILSAMSDETRTFFLGEIEQLGPMRLSEVEEVQIRCVQKVRQLEEEGKVTIVRGDADDTFV